MRIVMALLCASILAGFSANPATGADLSDGDIRKILIRNSIARYPGNCPCPYNTDRAGRRCGKRSAYSKPGGYVPLCYSQDVTKEMVERYRDQTTTPQGAETRAINSVEDRQ